ncbi:hypothetical protein [Deinococcus sp. QL22]|uniref:hypothetical protein n=1 Tax=Deinococcus sp. QL22 TaxID=2939437 RepID=UPI002017E32D|nr:hypothetical protein [Deinococcus sp. QL22]UQN09126.1 hypothetical protein M1R55_24090 [Deinococcus sp. QL22]
MDAWEKEITESLRRSQLLEEEVQELIRQIEITQAKIDAVEALRESWHWTESKSAQRHDN